MVQMPSSSGLVALAIGVEPGLVVPSDPCLSPGAIGGGFLHGGRGLGTLDHAGFGVLGFASFEFHHRAAQRVATEHIGLGAVVVVIVLILGRNIRLTLERAGVDGFDVASEFRVEFRIGDVELGLGDLDVFRRHIFAMDGDSGDGPRCVRCFEFLAPGLDQVGEVVFLVGDVAWVAAVLVALPPDKPGDLVALVFVLRVALAELA